MAGGEQQVGGQHLARAFWLPLGGLWHELDACNRPRWTQVAGWLARAKLISAQSSLRSLARRTIVIWALSCWKAREGHAEWRACCSGPATSGAQSSLLSSPFALGLIGRAADRLIERDWAHKCALRQARRESILSKAAPTCRPGSFAVALVVAAKQCLLAARRPLQATSFTERHSNSNPSSSLQSRACTQTRSALEAPSALPFARSPARAR